MPNRWRRAHGRRLAAAVLLATTLGAGRADAAPDEDAQAVRTTLGAGRGLRVESRDGRFGLQVRARIQPRATIERTTPGSSDDVTFTIRRARLKLIGHVFGPHARFYVQLGFSAQDMTGGLVSEDGSPRRVPLRDARVEFDHLRDATVWIGQMKVPWSRERMISDADLDMIDRSLVNAEFNLDRDVGMQVRSEDLGGFGQRLGYALGVFGGRGRNTLQSQPAHLLYVARFEIRPLGAFESDVQGDLARTPRPKLALGFAYAFHRGALGDRGTHGERPEDGGSSDLHEATVDAALRWRGLAVETAWLGRAGRRDPGDLAATVPVRRGQGWYLQAGALLPDTRVELVGRYALVRRTRRWTTSLADADELGGGVNLYLGGHDLKLEADYAHQWLRTAAGPAAADVLRLQVQLAI